MVKRGYSCLALLMLSALSGPACMRSGFEYRADGGDTYLPPWLNDGRFLSEDPCPDAGCDPVDLFSQQTSAIAPLVLKANVRKTGQPLVWRWGDDGPPTIGNVVEHVYALPGDKTFSVHSPDGLEGVAALAISDGVLSGPIAEGLLQLSALDALDLSHNQLEGGIPEQLGSLVKLRNLSLNNNRLSGAIPAQLATLSALRVLSLADNQLTGPIPSQLAELSALTGLALDHNALSATIPPELGALSQLVTLSLDHNGLSGSLPRSLGALRHLRLLLLSDNKLTGPIPSELGALAALTNLNLANNALSGAEPGALGGLSAITTIDLSSNQLDQASVDGILAEIYSARSMYSAPAKELFIAGSNAAPGPNGLSQAGELQQSWGWMIHCTGGC